MCEIISPLLISFPAASLETIRNCGRRESCGVRNISTPAHRPTRGCHRPPSRRWLSHRTRRRLGRPGTQEARTSPKWQTTSPNTPVAVSSIGPQAMFRSCGAPIRSTSTEAFAARRKPNPRKKQGPFPGEPSSPPAGAGAGSGELVRSRHSCIIPPGGYVESDEAHQRLGVAITQFTNALYGD